jgi:hypothetical protein
MGECGNMNILELMKKRESIGEKQKDFLITDIVFRSKFIKCIYQNSSIEDFQYDEEDNNYQLTVVLGNFDNGGSDIEIIFYFTKEEVLKKLDCRKTDDDFESYIYLLKSKDFEIEFWVDMEYFK